MEELTKALHAYLDRLNDIEQRCLMIKVDMVQRLLALVQELDKPDELQYVHDVLREELRRLPHPVAAPIARIIWGSDCCGCARRSHAGLCILDNALERCGGVLPKFGTPPPSLQAHPAQPGMLPAPVVSSNP